MSNVWRCAFRALIIIYKAMKRGLQYADHRLSGRLGPLGSKVTALHVMALELKGVRLAYHGLGGQAFVWRSHHCAATSNISAF